MAIFIFNVFWGLYVFTLSLKVGDPEDEAKTNVKIQGDTSKMGQTFRLNPCFNTVPTQLCFQITVLTNAIICLHWLA